MSPQSPHIQLLQRVIKTNTGSFLLYLLLIFYNITGTITLTINKHVSPSYIDSNTSIHPSAVISPWGVRIENSVVIGEKSVIKARTHIKTGTVIQDKCVIGDVGFQIFRCKDRRLLVIHTGRVVIGENVKIGSKTCIDRGLFRKATIIGPDTLIGNNVNIGHNIQIGQFGRVGEKVTIGGNTKIGERVTIGDKAVLSNRINIMDHTQIASGTIVTRSTNNP